MGVISRKAACPAKAILLLHGHSASEPSKVSKPSALIVFHPVLLLVFFLSGLKPGSRSKPPPPPHKVSKRCWKAPKPDHDY